MDNARLVFADKGEHPVVQWLSHRVKFRAITPVFTGVHLRLGAVVIELPYRNWR